jgi:hypothetical protein
MGKWSNLKEKLVKFVEEPKYQQRIDAMKPLYQPKGREGMFKELAALKVKKEKVEEQLKDINLRVAAIDQLLVTDLEGANEAAVKTKLGTFSLKDSPYPKVVDQRKLLEWVHDNKLDEILTVSYQTMAAMCKDRLQKGEDVMDGVEVYMKTSILFTKAS